MEFFCFTEMKFLGIFGIFEKKFQTVINTDFNWEFVNFESGIKSHMENVTDGLSQHR